MEFLTALPKIEAPSNNCAWSLPPLDGSLSVAQLYDWDHQHNPTHPVFIYGPRPSDRLTYSDLVPAAHRAGQYVAERAGARLPLGVNSSLVVAIFAASDTITYFTTLVGMARAGIPVLPISPRFSPPVVAHLLVASKIAHVFVGTEPGLEEVIHEAIRSLEDAGFGEHDFRGHVFACHALELFHTMGLFYINWLVSAGITMATFPPTSPPTMPTADRMFHSLVECNPSYIMAPPIFIRAWSKDSSMVKFIRERKGLLYGGRFLSKAVGDLLAEAGVQIYTIYGMTEIGIINSVFPKLPLNEWDYFRVNPLAVARFTPNEDGTYGLVIIADCYKVLGRMDDRIMLSTGDVVRYSGAMIFGRGRSTLGVMVEAASPSSDIKEIVWNALEDINRSQLKHLRIAKEASGSFLWPILFTGKGVPRRALMLGGYENEIEALYEAVSKTKHSLTPVVAL
ncbi:hypothetical protein C8J57DRAFT_1512097 [Mycena rebaudengoi]|nr:hypothetical protein C8J57DRAFT_1512097 [Mycena rebaudengoi]